MRWLAVAFVILGCSRQPRKTDPAPTPPREPFETVRDAAPPTPDATVELAAVDDRCAIDADCEVLAVVLSGEHVCCPSCQTTAVNREWARRFRDSCDVDAPRTCFPLGCPMGPMNSRCQGGRCILSP